MKNVWLYRPQPVFLPGYEYFSLFPQLNGRLCAQMLEGLLVRLGFEHPILWIYFVNAEPKYFRHSILVYDPIDEWSAAFDSPRYRSKKQFVSEMDEKLCRQADVVFVGSPAMLELKGRLNRHTYLVPHAVDYQHFAKASLSETKVPEDLARLPGPILGFSGSMMSLNFDADLVRRLAQAKPEWSVALVGQILRDEDGAIGALQELPNVHFLGMKPIGELPNYLKGFDVCLMPYKINDFTAKIYPLKQYEYLSAGKPIVSTPIRAALEHSEVVSIAGEADDFVHAIEMALYKDGPEERQRRVEVAQRNSWEANLALKTKFILEALA
jgi:glycosyltransferase involved in cell wall biosynthesis